MKILRDAFAASFVCFEEENTRRSFDVLAMWELHV